MVDEDDSDYFVDEHIEVVCPLSASPAKTYDDKFESDCDWDSESGLTESESEFESSDDQNVVNDCTSSGIPGRTKFMNCDSSPLGCILS